MNLGEVGRSGYVRHPTRCSSFGPTTDPSSSSSSCTDCSPDRQTTMRSAINWLPPLYQTQAQNWAVSLFLMTHSSVAFGDFKSHPLYKQASQKLLTFKPMGNKLSFSRPRLTGFKKTFSTKKSKNTPLLTSATTPAAPNTQAQEAPVLDVETIEAHELVDLLQGGEKRSMKRLPIM